MAGEGGLVALSLTDNRLAFSTLRGSTFEREAWLAMAGEPEPVAWSEAGPADGRGFGLALSRVVCRRSGGDLTVANDNGAVFTARFKRGATQP